MADLLTAGCDVSAGTYTCTKCGCELHVQSTTKLTHCPNCRHGEYESVPGVNSGDHPHPGS
jgi:hypothetical protein